MNDKYDTIKKEIVINTSVFTDFFISMDLSVSKEEQYYKIHHLLYTFK